MLGKTSGSATRRGKENSNDRLPRVWGGRRKVHVFTHHEGENKRRKKEKGEEKKTRGTAVRSNIFL